MNEKDEQKVRIFFFYFRMFLASLVVIILGNGPGPSFFFQLIFSHFGGKDPIPKSTVPDHLKLTLINRGPQMHKKGHRSSRSFLDNPTKYLASTLT